MTSVEINEIDSPEGKEWNKLYNSKFNDEGFVKIGKTKVVVPRGFIKFYETIKNFEIKDDDVWVITFPKSGTTWTQELVWLLMNDLDFEGAKINLKRRFPFFELQAFSPDMGTFAAVEELQSPRLIKSHLHFSLLPNQLMREESKAKIIIVTRNPKDAVVSMYHHVCLLKGYSGTLEQFAKQFVTDNVSLTPYWTHLKEYWNIRNRDNILFLKYEELKADLPSQILRTAEFLGKSLSLEELHRLTDHLSFESMKSNPAVNNEDIIRKFMEKSTPQNL